MTTESILQEAERLIHGDRNKNYGHPRENFDDIATMFAAYLEMPITDIDVANLMILVKVARVKGSGYHRDSFTDIAGYAGCVGRIYEEPLPVEMSGGDYVDQVENIRIEIDESNVDEAATGIRTQWLAGHAIADWEYELIGSPYPRHLRVVQILDRTHKYATWRDPCSGNVWEWVDDDRGAGFGVHWGDTAKHGTGRHSDLDVGCYGPCPEVRGGPFIEMPPK